ncbi:MAG: ATP-dependent zinc metalloprotease FtsH [Clostridiales bacterium]|nr:ATP-dependent zinc metalloprotease FtsH [Clostridiales bacterium]
MKTRIRWILLAAIAALAVAVVIGIISCSDYRSKELSITEFEETLRNGQVESVYADNYLVKIKYKDSDIPDASFPAKSDAYVYVHMLDPIQGYIKPFIEDYNDLQTDDTKKIAMPEFKNSNLNQVNVWSYLWPLAGVVGLVVLSIFLFRGMNSSNKQAISFSKSKARLNENIKVRFSDVAGAEEEKTELVEIVEFLKNPRKFEAVGARIPKGVLLVGQPGTGKTLFAKAIAGEANVPFYSISGSDFVEMFVGVGASRVRDLFEDAKKNMPCIVFIDEIDAVGRQRGTGMGGGHDEREQTLNQLLVQMDGFETNSGIIVMAATNRADILDPALLRPGRFDRQIYIHMPDVRGREEILKVHARNKPIANDVDFKILAKITSGFSGADIENLLNEAAILAARDNRKVINMLDINEGVNKVIMGPQKKSRVVTEVDKRITAYHEAGHAVVGHVLKHCDPVHEVSIIPRGYAAGYTVSRPKEDDNHMTMNKLLDDIAMGMGGRSAEEIVIKDVSTGAIGDIKSATDTARKMVTEWGMSSAIGPVYLGSAQELFLGRDYQSTHNYSEDVAATIDKEVKAIIESAHKRALDTLTEHRDVMDKMVRLLIERETIYGEEVDALFTGTDVKDIIAAMDKRLAFKSEQAMKAISDRIIAATGDKAASKPGYKDDDAKQ